MKGRLRDLTKIDTIYRKEIRTVRIRLRRTYAGSEDIELATVVTPADVHEIFRSIYAGLDDDQEHFVMMVLNAAGQVVGYKLIGSWRSPWWITSSSADTWITSRCTTSTGCSCPQSRSLAT